MSLKRADISQLQIHAHACVCVCVCRYKKPTVYAVYLLNTVWTNLKYAGMKMGGWVKICGKADVSRNRGGLGGMGGNLWKSWP